MPHRLILGRLVAVFALVAPLSAASQGILGIEGSWELAETVDIPAEGVLVFSRFTFTGSHLLTTAVTIDPDSGHLRGRTTDDRYIESDGQVIVRAFGNTTVLDVGRTPDGLVVRDTRTDVTLRFRPASPDAGFDPELIGAWATDAIEDDAWAIRFDAAGRAMLTRDGEEKDVMYDVAGPYLLIDKDPYRFTFVGDGLELEHGSDLIRLARSDARQTAAPTLTE